MVVRLTLSTCKRKIWEWMGPSSWPWCWEKCENALAWLSLSFFGIRRKAATFEWHSLWQALWTAFAGHRRNCFRQLLVVAFHRYSLWLSVQQWHESKEAARGRSQLSCQTCSDRVHVASSCHRQALIHYSYISRLGRRQSILEYWGLRPLRGCCLWAST